MTEPQFSSAKEYMMWQAEQMPGSVDAKKLLKALEIHVENKQRPKLIGITTNLGNLNVPVSDIDLKDSKNTTVLMGGAAGPFSSMQTVGAPLATMEQKVVMLPHVLNKSVKHDKVTDQEFIQEHRRFEERNGAYQPDGEYIAKLIEKMNLEGEIVGQIDLVGFSNGAPAMIKAAETLFKTNSPVAEKISKLILLHPGGCFSKEDTEGIRGVATRLGLASNFALDTIKASPLNDPNEWMLQMDDVQPRGMVPATHHIERIMSPVLEESIGNIPVPVHVVLGEEDKVIPADKIEKGIKSNEKTKHVKIHLVPGAGHNFFTKHGDEYARLVKGI